MKQKNDIIRRSVTYSSINDDLHKRIKKKKKEAYNTVKILKWKNFEETEIFSNKDLFGFETPAPILSSLEEALNYSLGYGQCAEYTFLLRKIK